MPKKNKKKNKGQKPVRQSNRKTTKKKTAKSVRQKYMSNRPTRIRKKPIAFTPCQNTNTYNRVWPPETVGLTTATMEVQLNAGNNVKKYVETLGDKGAKWHLCAQLLSKTIEDGDMTQALKNGYFYSFNGAHTVDSIYVNPDNGHVYVIEAKGTKKGTSANLITRQNGKTQGTLAYLDEVAAEMANSTSARKQEAANKIINCPPGKLHYVGVQTTYSVNNNGKVSAQMPKEIFNRTR